MSARRKRLALLGKELGREGQSGARLPRPGGQILPLGARRRSPAPGAFLRDFIADGDRAGPRAPLRLVGAEHLDDRGTFGCGAADVGAAKGNAVN